MTTIQKSAINRRRRSNAEKLKIGLIAVLFITCYFAINIWHHFMISRDFKEEQHSHPALRIGDASGSIATAGFVPTLRGKKILIEITTVGQSQYAYFENVLDSFRDLCEAGARVSLHVTTTNCDPDPKENDPECPLYGQSSEETFENNYSVEKIDQLNERLKCRDPEGSLDVSVHLVSPDWGKQVVDHHRRIFYERIDDGYDVFVHSEEDEAIRPTNILAFMDETERLRKFVGDERLPDYSIGFIRYENQMKRFDKRRVVWEFEWEDEVETPIDHPGIEGKYFTSPPFHHQGMFMATRAQLVAWATRGPDCKFDKPVRRPAYHRERTSGGMDLFNPEFCNVTQLLPLDSLEDLHIHHMPDKNNERTPKKILPTMDLHKRRMKMIQEIEKKKWLRTNKKYTGIKMFIDENNEGATIPFDLTKYDEYVKRGGVLSEEEFIEWEFSNQKFYEAQEEAERKEAEAEKKEEEEAQEED